MNRTSVPTVGLLAALVAATSAAIPLMSKDELREQATDIVTGTVAAVYTKEEKEPGWHHTRGVVEVRVEAVEKGDRIEPGEAVYARFWTQRWVGAGNPPPFGSGHDVPKAGQRVRAHLARKDGGYEALLPNGIEPLPKSGEPEKAPRGAKP